MDASHLYGNGDASEHSALPSTAIDVNIVSPYAALWARNERESRLLQLPAEIRLQIFDYVIGSWTVQVRLRWDTLISGFSYRCLEDTQPCVDSFKNGNQPWAHKQHSPKPAVPFDPSITVLSTVCRQLYRETAALPFKNFTWEFDTAFTLERFLAAEKKTGFHNKSAIRTVLVPSPGPYRSSEQILSDLRTIMLLGYFNPHTNEFESPSPKRQTPIFLTVVTLEKVKSSNTWVCGDKHAKFAKDLFEKPTFPPWPGFKVD